ncbi:MULTISPECIES: DUF3102 domain-containing protein [unclassified Bradyrhizobium]|uniref:DUF3102 domain-containing protein n=1 Tax=unclassified Bradyrhizobium TaxID=2631580 RepID=UPI0028E7B27D|nr:MULTISPECIES: DUF3102 domain-containing protein [unclassified Bradyrhizobium]
MKTNARKLDVIGSELQAAMLAEVGSIFVIGRLLLEAQEQLEHGQWREWLATNFGGSVSSAWNYQQAAKLAVKYPTVEHLKLQARAIYALSGLDLTANRKLIEAVLEEARTSWVDRDRVWAIAGELSRKGQPAKAEAETEPLPTFKELLDAPPPELPPAPAPAQGDVITPAFDAAIKQLATLHTKPLRKFANTTHTVSTLRAVGDFLHMVADRKGDARSGTKPITGEPMRLPPR